MDILWGTLPISVLMVVGLLTYIAIMETIQASILRQIRDQPQPQCMLRRNQTQPLEERDTKVLPAFRG